MDVSTAHYWKSVKNLKTNKSKKMEKQIKILIPYFCYCCSEGATEKSDNAFECFNLSKEKLLLDLDFVKSLFSEKNKELNNPNTFWRSIKDLFLKIENQYPNEHSKLVINSIKRLISVSAKELHLPQIKCGNFNQFVISDFDIWFDFLANLHFYIYTMDGMYYAKYSDSKIAFVIGRRRINQLEQYTEVMISEIEDYWKNQSV